jgi:arylsulfatase A-like enzyme
MERHDGCREGGKGYPCRAVRTREYLYIRNYEPDRWPAGNPDRKFCARDIPFGEVDSSPTKKLLMDNKDRVGFKRFYDLAFAKRPAEELYHVGKDPGQLENLAGNPEYAEVQKKFRARLQEHLVHTKDPRALGLDAPWDYYPYYGRRLNKNWKVDPKPRDPISNVIFYLTRARCADHYPMMKRFLTICTLAFALAASAAHAAKQPNILVLLTDQWRFDAFGHAGNKDVKTPNIDRLEKESINFTHALSGVPVCCPMRASLLTGQRPLTHGVFMNDVSLNPNANSIAKVLNRAGYNTGYIGKWHIDGRGRSSFIPRERRQGFEYWKVLECTHNYNNSFYYADGPEMLKWDGYDAIAQTRDAQQYIKAQAKNKRPFSLFIGFGPPHAPYHSAPEKYRAMYDPKKIRLRPNIPHYFREIARRDLAGYYAHCTALDDCVRDLWGTLKESGQEENTIIIFTSDHGDLIGSHGAYKKQQPYDESIRIPMLIHYPAKFGREGRRLKALINTEDIMPTLLGLSDVTIPKTVEGSDFSQLIEGGENQNDGAVNGFISSSHSQNSGFWNISTNFWI